MVTPAMHAPGFMLGAGTYDRTLTLEVSFYEPVHRKEEVEAFLEYIEMELKRQASEEASEASGDGSWLAR
jgi:NRPS condensation-like uncharacterized protein